MHVPLYDKHFTAIIFLYTHKVFHITFLRYSDYVFILNIIFIVDPFNFEMIK